MTCFFLGLGGAPSVLGIGNIAVQTRRESCYGTAK